MRNPVPPIVRVWRWGIALIVAVGLLGACPALTGTYIPFFLVCLQALVILALVALTIAAKVWQVLPAPLKLLVLLTIADRFAGQRSQVAKPQVQPIPFVPSGDEQRSSLYEQPSVNYPEMLPHSSFVAYRLYPSPLLSSGQAGGRVRSPARHFVSVL